LLSLIDTKYDATKRLDGTQIEQAKLKAAQAYDLFSQDKSPMEVAIALDLREPEVT